MKRKIPKILSVALALVLVLSFSLVTAVPAAASSDTLNVVPFKLQADGNGTTAEWSIDQSNTGSSSVYLVNTGDAGNEARIVIDASAVGVETLADISSISWWRYAVAGYPPHVDIILDVNGDGVVDAEDVLTAEMWYNNSLIPVGAQNLPDDFALWCPDHVGYDTWLQTFELQTPDGFDAVDDTSLLWLSKLGGGPGDAPWATLAQWKAGGELGGYGITADQPNAEIAIGVIDATIPVVQLEIEIDNWVYQTETYVDDIAINGVTYYGLIQDAIDAATAGDTISVAAGIYSAETTGETFPIVVSKALTIQSVSGAATTFITPTSSDLGAFNVTAAGVTIGGSGFTIGAGGCAGIYALPDGGSGITVQDCIFKSYADDQSRGMWFEKLWNGALITGNSFATPRLGTGIMVVNADGATIENNTVASGMLKYCFLTFKAETFYPAGHPEMPYAEYVAWEPSTIDDVTVTGNSVSGMEAGWQAILFASSKHDDVGELPNTQNLTVGSVGVDISGNTFTTNGVGVQIDKDKVGKDGSVGAVSGVANIKINYNSFSGNTMAVDNGQTTTVNALYNWWGDATGPEIATNPYNTEAITARGDTCSANVDYIPWLIHTELASGWNIYSTPIALDSSCDTIKKALDLWTTDSTKVTGTVFYFNAATGLFELVTNLTPLVPIYININLTSAATIDVLMNTDYSSPPSKTMYQGWNLVGPAQLYAMDVDEALASAYYATGGSNPVGYSQVVSPGIHQTLAWTFIRGPLMYTVDEEPPDMIPTEGYWVYMVNQGTLGGFTYTPITEVQ